MISLMTLSMNARDGKIVLVFVTFVVEVGGAWEFMVWQKKAARSTWMNLTWIHSVSEFFSDSQHKNTKLQSAIFAKIVYT